MNSSKRAHQKYPDLALWQRSFHEHVIRSERDWRDIWEYIDRSPAGWAEDRYFEQQKPGLARQLLGDYRETK